MRDSGKPVSGAFSAASAALAPTGENRRLAERKLLRGRAQLQFTGRPPMEVRTLDISASGMAVASPSNLPAAAPCALQLVLPLKTGRFPLQVNARVVHSVFSNAEGGFKVGMQFLGVSSAMSAAITQYIEGK
jgi:c-di-GMP-binding flagellar brake protein YcgR